MRTLELNAGKDSLRLSRLVFGTGSVGGSIAFDEAADLLDLYRAEGGCCIDTARMYGKGASEEAIGRYIALRNCRSEVALSTKGGFPSGNNMHHSRIRPAALRSDLEASLRALGTDYVDLYFLHRDDPEYPVEVLMPFLDSLVREGKVRFLGASNWTAARIAGANRFAAANGLTPFTISQIQWSLAAATPAMWEDDTIVCMDNTEEAFYRQACMPVMAFTPLTRGFFSKAIAEGVDSPALERYAAFKTPLNLARVERVRALCDRYNATPAQICHAFLTSGSLAGLAVLGAKNRVQLTDSLTGADLTLTAQDLEFLCASDVL
ncbi:aldo/keto reductase [Anaerotruncus colihominis]|uniref:aldo/keto reductase n=1 Tax=Anaerotruncus colihominis TaxID=169435 RepID=UPI002431818B|nr:aldo/keto reductase [Anaerotruncus colihominis]